MKKIGKKKKIGMIPGMKAFGPMNKTGMMAIDWATEELYYKDEYGITRRKEKERTEKET